MQEGAGDGGQDDAKQGRQQERRAALVRVVDAVHANHHHLGVADPHHVDDAENEVQPQRQQRQQARQQQPVDERLHEEDVELAVHLFSSEKGVRPLASSVVFLATVSERGLTPSTP